jgi:hypothetical protein
MGTTPAARLAHLRDVFGERWRIEDSARGQDLTRVFTASERATGRIIVTTSLSELEQQLTRAEWGTHELRVPRHPGTVRSRGPPWARGWQYARFLNTGRGAPG